MHMIEEDLLQTMEEILIDTPLLDPELLREDLMKEIALPDILILFLTDMRRGQLIGKTVCIKVSNTLVTSQPLATQTYTMKLRMNVLAIYLDSLKTYTQMIS